MNVWVPVVSALVASLFTFLIAWLSNCWNESRFNTQRKDEKEKENKKLLIEKGEKLFGLICTFTAWGSRKLGHDFQGKIPTNQEFDYIELELITKIYFPELENDVAEMLDLIPKDDNQKSSDSFKKCLQLSDSLKNRISSELIKLTK
ncbi:MULTISPECIES: hypothetical protein [Xenorhabdus]|uniref:hypothetical protein n=1 Tax=Xenorhabdus TaxID=626 RepID=UPI000646E12A|nr:MULTISPECIES: hypothetical protein [Xenorhabdus]